MNRKYLFILISFIALLAVVLIQVNWIVKSAALKEELFNEKAKIVLSKASEAISKDKVTCKKIGETFESDVAIELSQFEVIDSLFNYYMNFYKIDMDYSYKILAPEPLIVDETYKSDNVFNQELIEGNLPAHIHLELVFSAKQQFILAEMGVLFFTSLGLIAVVFIFFFLTLKSLLKEKELSERTTEFLNNMTHEFKTPLTNIGLAAKMIQKKAIVQKDSKITSFTKIIQFEKNKLSIQIEQVLRMAGIEKAEIPLQIETIDLHLTIEKAIKIMNLQLEEKDGFIKLQLTAQNSIIEGDQAHLLNTLCNLISNAIKYNHNTPQVTIKTDSNHNLFTCSISDNGIGIDQRNHMKVFEKYYRVQKGNIHECEGFGIGLAYAKKIMELHSGNISLKSELQRGSSFKLTLPYGEA